MTSKSILLTLLFCFPFLTFSQDKEWSPQEAELIRAIEKLSEATSVENGNIEDYSSGLSEDFTRWRVGEDKLYNKAEWVPLIEEWLKGGWGVSDRSTSYVEVRIDEQRAFVRRIVEETHKSPKGRTNDSNAAIAEVWVKRENRWLLQRVNVHPMD